jgi:alanine racemase
MDSVRPRQRSNIEGLTLAGKTGRSEAGATVTVDVGAIRHNYRDGLAKLGPDITPAAVIKADGYGLGANKLAKVLVEEGCRDFFVARISEAVDLRKALQAENPDMARKIAINVLDGPLAGSDPQFLIDNKITPVLNSLEQVQAWNQAAKKQGVTLPAILQVDSGMNRAGMHAQDLSALLADREGNLGNVKLQYIMTHLAKAGNATPGVGESREAGPDSKQQLANFEATCAHFPGVKASIGASSTVFLGHEFHKDMVRLGGTFHGQAPFDADSNPLRQVVKLESKIAQVRNLEPADAIGYGLNFTAQQAMKVATIPIGYADGMPRIGGGNRPGDAAVKPYVLVAGKYKAPLVGATSMDMTTIDVSHVPTEALKPGASVTLIGGEITSDHFGAMYNTNASEAQTKLASRVRMEFREDPNVPAPAPSEHASANAWDVAAPVANRAQESLLKRALLNSQTGRLKKDAAGAIVTVDVGAIRHNYRDGLAKLGPDITPAAVIKADGYGLGANKLAKVLVEEGCRDFFVARISEAVDLRKALQAENPDMARKIAINVLDGPLAGSDPQFLIDNKITPVLNSLEQVQAWNQAAKKQGVTLPAILQVDSGMNRAGMHAQDLSALLADREGNLGNVKLQYIMTHLAKAGNATPGVGESREAGPDSKQQLANFEATCAHFPGVKASIGASSTVFLGHEFHKDMVRLGGTFHGQAPFDADSNPLRQVVKLESKIAQVRNLEPADAIGYGLNFTAQQAMKVATIPIGYADGMPRIGGGNRPGDAAVKPYVLVAGKYKAPLVGATSMDMTTIDVSHVPTEALKPGASVTLIGGEITSDHFGAMYDTNASQAQTNLTSRVFMEHREDPHVPAPPPNSHASQNAWADTRT